jgi:hypothetical protein
LEIEKKIRQNELLKLLAVTLAESCLQLLSSDQLPHYAQVILKVFGRWIQPVRKGMLS